jgi:polyisoprenoid-binding protein YceI
VLWRVSHKSLASIACAASLAAIGCGTGAHRGTLVEPRSAHDPGPASGSSAAVNQSTYCVDPKRSSIVVAGSDLVLGEHVGSVGRYRAALRATAGSPRKLLVQFDLTSVHLESGFVEDFVKSDDFLDVQTYPEASFDTSEMLFDADSVEGEVVGNLTLHGYTRTFRFPVTTSTRGSERTLQANVLLPRTAFDIRPRKHPWDFFIHQDFRIALELTLVAAGDSRGSCPSNSPVPSEASGSPSRPQAR